MTSKMKTISWKPGPEMANTEDEDAEEPDRVEEVQTSKGNSDISQLGKTRRNSLIQKRRTTWTHKKSEECGESIDEVADHICRKTSAYEKE